MRSAALYAPVGPSWATPPRDVYAARGFSSERVFSIGLPGLPGFGSREGAELSGQPWSMVSKKQGAGRGDQSVSSDIRN